MKKAIFDVSRLNLGENGATDYYWPVSRAEITAVRDTYLQAIIPEIQQSFASSPHARLTTCFFMFLNDILNLYVAQALLRRSERDQRTPVFDNCAHDAHALMTEELIDNKTVNLLRKGAPQTPKLKQIAKHFRDRYRGNILRQSDISLIDLENAPVTIATGPFITQHAKLHGGVNYIPLGTWFPGADTLKPHTFGPAPEKFIQTLIACVSVAFKAGNEELEDTTKRILLHWIETALDTGCTVYADLQQRKKQIPKQLWRGTGGMIWGRLLSLVCQELGGTVTGHDHSHGQGPWSSYSDTILELPLCNRFMVHTQTQKEMAERNLRPDLLCPSIVPEISFLPQSLKTPEPAQVLYAHSKHTGRRPRAMYVGTLYTNNVVLSPLLPGPTLLDWETRLLNKLVEFGWDVIYKPHPENKVYPAAELYAGQHMRIENGRFENVMDQADILVFAQSTSSSFFNSLRSDKPIILPTPPLNPWQPEALELISKRCAIVATHIDENNRMQTDWDNLKEALEVSQERPGTEISHTFLTAYC